LKIRQVQVKFLRYEKQAPATSISESFLPYNYWVMMQEYSYYTPGETFFVLHTET
jgi:hypothetical protein